MVDVGDKFKYSYRVIVNEYSLIIYRYVGNICEKIINNLVIWVFFEIKG